ncbi:sialidase family protein [Paenibacillus eucommiae]|uniref:Sialidase domain-containing protein n=1 Tax=Paenibacillus eucommiae TaxID=1355755 RepID=A0ABS4IRC0_9BACL|nr:sialidase family protein [Paenibacillus eucommiae]MBP1990111.1 hypothetical protein [Paenibacillus eucommiae]
MYEQVCAGVQPEVALLQLELDGGIIVKIAAKGIVYKGAENSAQQSCGSPGICVLPGGRWICTFRAAPRKVATSGQHVLLTWSDDEGLSWSEPIRPFAPPLVGGKPGLLRCAYLTALGEQECIAVLCWVDHSDPELPFFNEETEGLLDTKIMLSRSSDRGEHWTEPELMDTSPFSVPVPLTGPILRLTSGALACQFELNKHYDDLEAWRHSSVLLFSKDGGSSWPEHVIVSSDPANRIFYWDQRPGVLADGTLLNLFWTYDTVTAAYLNVHARTSTDDGYTWSDYRDIGVPGQPAPPAALPDGRIAMVYVDRTAAPTIKLRISDDNGVAWPDDSEVILYEPEQAQEHVNRTSMQDAWAEMGKFSVGLPVTSVLNNGDVLVFYYAGTHSDHTGIEWVRVRQGGTLS